MSFSSCALSRTLLFVTLCVFFFISFSSLSPASSCKVLAHHGAVENNVVKVDLPVIQVLFHARARVAAVARVVLAPSLISSRVKGPRRVCANEAMQAWLVPSAGWFMCLIPPEGTRVDYSAVHATQAWPRSFGKACCAPRHGTWLNRVLVWKCGAESGARESADTDPRPA